MNYEGIGTQSDYSEEEGNQKNDVEMSDATNNPSIIKGVVAET